MSPLVRRSPAIAVGTLCAALCAVAAAYASAFVVAGGAAWSVPLFIVGVCLSMGALMALGVGRNLGAAMHWLPVLLAVVMVAAGLLLAWALPGQGEPLWLGLPRRAAIVLYGAGLLPMFLLPAAYALTFDRWTLRAEDLARVRAARAAMLRDGRLPSDTGEGG